MDRLTNALSALVLYVGGIVYDAIHHGGAHHETQVLQTVHVETQTFEELEHVAEAAVTELATIESASQPPSVLPPRPVIVRAEDPPPEVLNPQQPFIGRIPHGPARLPMRAMVFRAEDPPAEYMNPRQPIIRSGRVPRG